MVSPGLHPANMTSLRCRKCRAAIGEEHRITHDLQMSGYARVHRVPSWLRRLTDPIQEHLFDVFRFQEFMRHQLVGQGSDGGPAGISTQPLT